MSSNVNDVSDDESETPANTLWSSADRGDTDKVRTIIFPQGGGGSDDDDWDDAAAATDERDVNARNCLGCTPLLYACGSGHVETVCGMY
jgi:hypothetical protein